jgi:hypothetical protein
MPVRIIRNMPHSPYRVEWQEFDGFARDRNFDSYNAAERFAAQVEYRLSIDAITLGENEATPLPLLTEKEAAAYLGVKPGVVAAACTGGRLRFFRVGKTTFYTVESVRRFFEGCGSPEGKPH